MGKSVYFENCLREIRQSVYGRDNRKPIADAILAVKDEGHTVIVKRLTKIEAILNAAVVDWIEFQPRTVYVNYQCSASSTSGLTTTQIATDDYLLTDAKSGDSVSQIGTNDYLLTMGGDWSSNRIEEGSYIVYDAIPHHETYTMVLRALGA